MKEFDVIIIGSGPGGYIAAIRASQLKMKVAIVESADLGGICLNWGCIPTKSLLKSAELVHSIETAKTFGVNLSGTFDIDKIVQRSRNVSKTLSNGVGYLMKKNGITVIMGRGMIAGKSSDKWAIEVSSGKNKETYYGKHIIMATGARARPFPGVESHERVWMYRDALVPKTLPKTMVVIGSGAIGLEFSDFYHALGVNVTVLEGYKQIMGSEDAEIAKIAMDALIKKGMSISLSTTVESIKSFDDHVEISYKDSKGKAHTVKSDVVLVAIGVVGNVENLGLEKTKVTLKGSHIEVDAYSQTQEKGIYAIGDVSVKTPWLAHKASHEGIICVEKIAGLNPHSLNPLNVPSCYYTNPQVGSVGLSEEAAKKAGYQVKVGKFPLMGNGKSVILNEGGLVKTIIDAKTGELLGAHMIGPEVTEMIQGFVVGKTMEGLDEDFVNTIFPHPTISESMGQSILSALGRPLDI